MKTRMTDKMRIIRLDEDGRPVGQSIEVVGRVVDMGIRQECVPAINREDFLFFENEATLDVEFTTTEFVGMWNILTNYAWRVDFNKLVAPRLTRLQRWWWRVRDWRL